MFTKEGRLAELAFLKGVFASSPPSWGTFYLYVVLTDIAESADHDNMVFGSWATSAVASYSTTNPFTNAPANVSGVPTLAANEVTWTNATGSAQTPYGWAITFYDGSATRLLNYKRFASPASVANGGTFAFTPKIFKGLPA